VAQVDVIERMAKAKKPISVVDRKFITQQIQEAFTPAMTAKDRALCMALGDAIL
jgi:hypothetical protein